MRPINISSYSNDCYSWAVVCLTAKQLCHEEKVKTERIKNVMTHLQSTHNCLEFSTIGYKISGICLLSFYFVAVVCSRESLHLLGWKNCTAAGRVNTLEAAIRSNYKCVLKFSLLRSGSLSDEM